MSEPVCPADKSEEAPERVKPDGEESSSGGAPDAVAENSADSTEEPAAKGVEPDVVSSSRESGGQVIRNNQEIRVRDKPEDEEDEDEDSNDAGGAQGSNGDREFNPAVCSPYSPFPSSNSKSNPFGASQNILRGPILRPSAFTASFSCQPAAASQPGSGPSSGFVLRPPKLIPNSGSVGTKVQAQVTCSNPTPQFVPLEKEEGSDGEETSKVPPPVVTTSAPATEAAFVFGSNLEERVEAAARKRKLEEEEAAGVKKASVEEERVDVNNDVVREVITGEEGEVNVMQLGCRLFIFDSAKSTWVERGRGTLRLNDSKTTEEESRVGSRLIVRSKGSLRVMLNTKVWDGMRVEKVGEKGIRLMAVDLEAADKDEDNKEGAAAAFRIFLIMTNSISDALSLSNALESRVRKL